MGHVQQQSPSVHSDAPVDGPVEVEVVPVFFTQLLRLQEFEVQSLLSVHDPVSLADPPLQSDNESLYCADVPPPGHLKHCQSLR